MSQNNEARSAPVERGTEIAFFTKIMVSQLATYMALSCYFWGPLYTPVLYLHGHAWKVFKLIMDILNEFAS